MAKVRVVLTGHGRGEVFVDGQKVERVKSVALTAAACKENRVTLTLIPDTVEIEGECEVTSMDDEVRRFVAFSSDSE